MVKRALFALGVAAVFALAPGAASAQREFHGGFAGEDGTAAVGAAAIGIGADRLSVRG